MSVTDYIPQEVDYLTKYEEFKHYIDSAYEMPDNMMSLLVHFLEQNNGKLSKRAKEKEFSQLTEDEIDDIQSRYGLIFVS